jgi:hypothetical protein
MYLTYLNIYRSVRFDVLSLFRNRKRLFVAIALTFTLTACGNDSPEDPEDIEVIVETPEDDTTAPTITSGITFADIDETATVGQVIYTLTSDDSTATYSLSGDASDLFAINANTGEITLISLPDFTTQSSYSLTLTATDSAGNSASITITLTINDKTAPVITSSTATAIDENSGAGQVVYTVTSDDNDATYSLSGTDSTSFTIDDSTGAVTLTDNPSFTTQSSYSITVTATDVAGNGASITITLTIIDKTAPVITSSTATAIDENSGAGQVVYTVTSDDSAATFTFSGTDSASFTFDDSTGAVTLTDNPDFEAQSSYSFTITATDSVDNASSSTVELTINNIALTSFNLGGIDAASGDIKQMTLTWDSAAESVSETITYTVCEKDISQTNNCNELTSVTDELTVDVTVNSLVSALSTDYFILASSGGEFEASSEANVSTDEVTKMIGYFKASNAEDYDKFGYSLAISGDGHTLAVSAYEEDNSATGVITDGSESPANGGSDEGVASNSGAVYLFSNNSGKWLQTAYVKASNAEASDGFGYSITLSDDGATLAVGARNEDNGATGIITDGSESLSTSGGGDVSTASGAGAVYLFSNSSGTWSQTTYIKASNTGVGDNFGSSVSLSGDGTMLAVGAESEGNSVTGVITDGSEVTDVDTAYGSGAVYLFSNSGGVWGQTAYVKASNTGAYDRFGSNVALSSDGATLAVSSDYEGNSATGVITDGSESLSTPGGGDVSTISNAGAVYLFNNTAGVWAQTAYVKASNTGELDDFGYSIALSGDGNTLAVGAKGEDNGATGIITDGSESPTNGGGDEGAASSSGAVYLFSGSSGTWTQTAYVKASNADVFHYFGHSVALSGDGNTLVVGALYEGGSAEGVIIDGTGYGTAVNSGAAYLFSNSDNTWVQTAYVKASNAEVQDAFGTSVALSNDGATLAVGVPFEDNSATGIITDGSEIDGDVGTASLAGAVYVY